MPSLLLDALSILGKIVSFGPLIALGFYLLAYHGQSEPRSNDWL